jgi:arsenate reductase
MSEVGIDISDQYSKDLRRFLGKLPVRVAISVCAAVEADCPTNWPSALSLLSWPLEDPAACAGSEEERVATFRSVRDKLDRQIRSWLSEVGPSASLN